jgi:hypothetical protein
VTVVLVSSTTTATGKAVCFLKAVTVLCSHCCATDVQQGLSLHKSVYMGPSLSPLLLQSGRRGGMIAAMTIDGKNAGTIGVKSAGMIAGTTGAGT